MFITYDSVIITLILVADSLSMVLMWQSLQQKRKQYIQRKVSLLLKSLRTTSHA